MTQLRDALVCYTANASSGRGGQGEFLRQMVYALDELPRARVISRSARGRRVECIDIPKRGWRERALNAIQRTPLLRRRRDLVTLLDDVDFDVGASKRIHDVQLLDGVMGQCAETFEVLQRRRVPLVLTALNMHLEGLAAILEEENRRLGVGTRSYIHPAMLGRVRKEVALATRLRVVSEAAKQSFLERGVPAERIDVLMPALDLDHFQPSAQQDDVFRVLAVLTIDPRKGAYYLLQAFEKAAIPNSELVIIGATGDRWSHQMLHGFLGRVKNIRLQSADVLKEPVANTYGPASVLVHPAIEDGFALAVSQALACGKPVITTRQTGASQLIREGENGYVLECRDVDGLVDRLRLLARDRPLLGRLSAAAPASVAHLGYPAVAAQVAGLYSRVLADA
jgi:glycosyltransferase involved in cell wall biosynthesis